MLKHRILLCLMLASLLALPGLAIAQEVTDIEVDVPAMLVAAEAIFLTGVGGQSVLGLVSVVKRILKAQGIAVIAISIVISAGVVLMYLLGMGFVLWKFIVYTGLVAAAANGIYLFPKKRTG